MAYVLKSLDGKYLAPAGSKKSYTSNIQLARKFKTFAEAYQNACHGNERVVKVELETRRA